MQFIDLKKQQERIRGKIVSGIEKVLDSGQYIMGAEIKELERKLAEYTGAKNAIGCASGTDALLMALMAYEVGPGDAVFTTPFTFVATAEVISLLGATPVFVDINKDTFNMDPIKLEQSILAVENGGSQEYPLPMGVDGLLPKGIIPVDLFGQTADYAKINEIAERHGLFVIEDACQSFGAEYEGRKACSLADIACTSFFPAKPLGCYGDGGMVFTDDDELAKKMISIRVHGSGSDKYDNIRLGINGRLDTIQAAILLAKFEIFPEEIELRQTVAERYSRLLKDKVTVPFVEKDCKSAWAQYSILCENRDEMMGKLKSAGVPTAIYYPIPLHLQGAYRYLGYEKGSFPVSEDIAEHIFSIPMHPYLTEEEQENIARLLSEA
ncbi:MAG TPA: DegT/DnrJ/EryC1/StrS family aminotransferase [Desulfomonilia bacterium]